MDPAHVSSFRRIAAAIWSRPREPTIHGILEVDMTAALAHIERVRATGEARPTVTHLVVRAAARALGLHPAANAHARRGRIRPLPTVDIFVQVDVGDGADLSGALVREADRKSLLEIEQEIRDRAARIRDDRDPLFSRARRTATRLPPFVLRRALWASEWISNGLGLDLPRLGIPRRPFGSACVTSVGMLGIEVGLPPFFPLADGPILLCVGKVHDRPVAVDGAVEVRPICLIGAAIDHRVLDGALIARLAAALREYLADPDRFEAPDPA